MGPLPCYEEIDKLEIMKFWSKYHFVHDSILYSKNKILKRVDHSIFQNMLKHVVETFFSKNVMHPPPSHTHTHIYIHKWGEAGSASLARGN